MLMRYHWSLGIGHTYSHRTDFKVQTEPGLSHTDDIIIDIDEDDPTVGGQDLSAPVNAVEVDEEDPNPDDPELTMDERENEDLGPEPDEERDDFRGESDDEGEY